MNYGGYAFTSTEREEQKKISDKYKEICHLRPEIEFKMSPAYARTNFTGKLMSERARELSEMDILIIADHGNLCFGGSCTKDKDGNFTGSYCTD